VDGGAAVSGDGAYTVEGTKVDSTINPMNVRVSSTASTDAASAFHFEGIRELIEAAHDR
jgi:hypothetical protein